MRVDVTFDVLVDGSRQLQQQAEELAAARVDLLRACEHVVAAVGGRGPTADGADLVASAVGRHLAAAADRTAALAERVRAGVLVYLQAEMRAAPSDSR